MMIIPKAMDSMHTNKLFATLSLMVLVGAAGCDRPPENGEDAAAPAATEQPGMPQQEMDPEMMQQIMELQEIQQQLEPIQQEALQDEALASQLESLQLQVTTAMQEESGEALARMETLQEEMQEAQTAGDEERMQALMAEGQGLQQELQAVQAEVMARPEIRGPVDEFEAAHRARMIEIDPEAEELLDRFDELVASLPR